MTDGKKRKELEARVAEALKAKGIRMFTSSCGCCEGVTFSLEIDGKMICENAEHFNFSNFGDD